MSSRPALRLLSQPTRSFLVRQFASASEPRPKSVARFLPDLGRRPASPCFRCSLRAAIRLASTDSQGNQDSLHKSPDRNLRDAIELPPPAGSSETLRHPPEEEAPSREQDAPPSEEQAPPKPKRPDSLLPSETEKNRNLLSARFSTFMDNLQTRALEASQTLNDLTGYSAIERIKAENAAIEESLACAQTRLRAARNEYKRLTAHRAATQREVTTLLARKDTWAPADLERFTELYRADHEVEARVTAAAAELTEAEADESRTSAALNAGILKRYHEEQVWSDRIRRQSTWGTWGLMGVNVLIFLAFQFIAEPWKRARLVKAVTERERLVLDEVRSEMAEMRDALKGVIENKVQQGLVVEESVLVPTEAPTSPEQVTTEAPKVHGVQTVSLSASLRGLNNPEKIKSAVKDLYSERRIDLRMRDASLLVLQSATAGAVVAAAAAFVVLRKT